MNIYEDPTNRCIYIHGSKNIFERNEDKTGPWNQNGKMAHSCDPSLKT